MLPPVKEGTGGLPASIVAAERWRQAGRELRTSAPDVFLAMLAVVEAMVADSTRENESIDETSMTA